MVDREYMTTRAFIFQIILHQRILKEKIADAADSGVWCLFRRTFFVNAKHKDVFARIFYFSRLSSTCLSYIVAFKHVGHWTGLTFIKEWSMWLKKDWMYTSQRATAWNFSCSCLYQNRLLRKHSRSVNATHHSSVCLSSEVSFPLQSAL